MNEPEIDTFNIDEWLAGASRVTKFIEVIGKPHLQAEIDELDARLSAMDPGDPERQGIADQILTLSDEMEASRVGFKLASLPGERVEALRKMHKRDEEASAFAIIAEQVVKPAGLKPEDIRHIRDALGDGYFAQTIMATAASAQQGIGVAVPFSSAASRVRTR